MNLKVSSWFSGLWHNLRKLLIVLYWKNFTLKCRHYVMSTLEIVVPTLLFVAVLAIFQWGGDNLTPSYKNETLTEMSTLPQEYCMEFLTNHSKVFMTNCKITKGCAHNGTSGLVTDIIKKLNTAIQLIELIPLCGGFNMEILPIASEEDLLTEYASYEQLTEPSYSLFGGVVFEEKFDYIDKVVPPLNYKIRFGKGHMLKDTKFLFPRIQLSGPGEAGDQYKHFVMVQSFLDLAYTEIVTGIPLLNMGDQFWLTAQQAFPYPEHLSNNVAVIIGFLLPLFTVLSFCFVVPPILKRIVDEKETGVKELMKLMGLPNWMHWLCWFIDAVGSACLTVIILVLLLCVKWDSSLGSVIHSTNAFIILLFFAFYAMSLVVFLFAISTIFKSPNTALAVGLIIHLITFLIPFALVDDETYATIAIGPKLFMALLPNVNLWWGIKIITADEIKGTGIQWNNLFSRLEPADPMMMGLVWVMFFVSILFFGVITWYVDNVKPGKYGVARKWYFLIQLSYWKSVFSSKNKKGDSESYHDISSSDLFEDDPEGLDAGVSVRNLRKVFKSFTGKTVVAVDSVSFSAFQSHITALLGHNGAGKTTTMSVLTGMYSPTSGYAKINGHSIETELKEARGSLGLCPQHNMLFRDLTSYEHLMIFAMIKGLSWKESESQADRYIRELKLEPKKNVKASKLSGGMKRKVHLGVSLIGDSKVVLLDEPTSGMDPEARRVIWDLLQKEKKKRSILLTTHFMEEADVLGDRIAIMAKGRVHCCGSPMFLKKKFGDGYTLTVSRGPNSDIEGIKDIILKRIAGSSVSNETKRELLFNLPLSQAKSFPEMFETLEKEKLRLDYLNLGLTATTMEDVFLRVGNLTEDETDQAASKKTESKIPTEKRSESKRATGMNLLLMQLRGLITKRIIYTKRRSFLYGITAFIPIFMALICQIMINSFSTPAENNPPLEMSLSIYDKPVTYFQSNFTDETIQSIFQNLIPAGKTKKFPDVEEAILDIGSEDLALYRNNLIVAAQFNENASILNFSVNQTVSMYNTIPNHARPIAQNIMSNALLKYLGGNSSKDNEIKVTNHPLPETYEFLLKGILSQFVSPNSIFYGISLGTGVIVFASVFVIFPLSERITNAKQVQLMTGVSPITFWFSNILVDGVLFGLSLTISTIILLALDGRETFTSNGAAGPVILILVIFCVCGVLMSYVMSFLANSPPSGFTLAIISNILVGSIAPVVVWSLASIGRSNDNLVLASRIVRYICTFFPSFPMVRGIIAVAQVQEQNNRCKLYFERETLNKVCELLTFLSSTEKPLDSNLLTIGPCCTKDYVDPQFAICENSTVFNCLKMEGFFTWDNLNGINIDLVFLIVDLIILMTILIFIETGISKEIWAKINRYRFDSKRTNLSQSPLDDDVRREGLRVSASGSNEDVLLVDHLVKNYGALRAVNELSFGVKPEECFGLLGINGAGKTTTFRMLTGDEILTSGSATLLNKRLVGDRKTYLSMIGYCPQFDSIIEVMTGREMLILFSRLRGILNFEEESNKWLDALDIQKYADRPCGTYSGGNKRKLNIGLALVGDPVILFMDEPTTGVDPSGRRKLWDIIKQIKKAGQSVVLTSHSMEECEALCDRLTIMVNGQFKCIGTTSHIKKKFGQGFTIVVKLNTRGRSSEASFEIMGTVKNYMEKNFSGCEVKDEHKDYLHFHISDTTIPWSGLFLIMEEAKRLFVDDILTDYSVSETTLEEVFISFAKHQRPQSDIQQDS